MYVNNNIKTIRIERNILQEDLARAVNCSSRSMSRYETGERCPSLEMAMRIACYLQLGLDELFYLEDDSKS